jgi:hypothetical protein
VSAQHESGKRKVGHWVDGPNARNEQRPEEQEVSAQHESGKRKVGHWVDGPNARAHVHGCLKSSSGDRYPSLAT